MANFRQRRSRHEVQLYPSISTNFDAIHNSRSLEMSKSRMSNSISLSRHMTNEASNRVENDKTRPNRMVLSKSVPRVAKQYQYDKTEREATTQRTLNVNLSMVALDVSPCAEHRYKTFKDYVTKIQDGPAENSSNDTGSNHREKHATKFKHTNIAVNRGPEELLTAETFLLGSPAEPTVTSPIPQTKLPKCIHRIIDKLYIGSIEAVYSENLLCDLNIVAIVDVTRSLAEPTERELREVVPCLCGGGSLAHPRVKMAVDLQQFVLGLDSYIIESATAAVNKSRKKQQESEKSNNQVENGIKKVGDQNPELASVNTIIAVSSDKKSKNPNRERSAEFRNYKKVLKRFITTLEEVNQFINQARYNGQGVLIHSYHGRNRCAFIVAQYLMGEKLAAGWEEVVDIVVTAAPETSLNTAMEGCLKIWERVLSKQK